MENEIELISNNNQVVVSSRQVAANFGKQHKNVIQNIENIKAENSAVIDIEAKEATYPGRRFEPGHF